MKHLRTLPALLLSATILSNCQSASTVSPNAEVPVSEWIDIAPSTIEPGIWASDGYGYVIDSREGQKAVYEATPTLCMKTDITFDDFEDFYDTATVHPDGDIIRFGDNRLVHRTQYRRLDVLPEPCETPLTESDPQSVFEAFAAYFDTHYIFFDLFGVDWSERVEQTRPSVSPTLSDQALYDVLTGMLDGISDSHVELTAEIDGERVKFDAADAAGVDRIRHYMQTNASLNDVEGPAMAAAFFNGYLTTNISETLLDGDYGRSANGYMRWGMVDEGVGYLAIMNVADYSVEGDENRTTPETAIRYEMERALTDLDAKGAEAIILDLSINFGGYDYVSRIVADHLSAALVETYTKQARDTENPIPPTQLTTNPTPNAFTGPVYLLTSNGTVSGGEILTMSLRALPNVLHYGERTRGALSDKLEKPLPNGWEITLSNELYLDHEGKAWEGKGIPPTRPLPVFETDDPLASHLAAVRKIANDARQAKSGRN